MEELIASIGHYTLVLTFLLALFGVGAAAYGGLKDKAGFVESARRSMLLTWPLLTISSLALIWLLTTGQYEFAFVWSVTSESMPVYLKLTALWGGQSGSLLFWAWLMAAFASAVCLRKWDRDRELLPWVIVVTMATLAFFLFLILFAVEFNPQDWRDLNPFAIGENPFGRLWLTPEGEQITAVFQPVGAVAINPHDGQGLNPLLRHIGMVIHPPMLYLGFVAFVIPYAFAIAALVAKRSDDRWIRVTRRWTLVAWLFLSLGLILGMRWAYDVLGWGGYWGWDPVEIAAFMPWLTGTAFLHSVMVQEKKGMLKRWNMVLIIITFALVIFGTFLTRSGVLSSVHAFAESAIGPTFFTFIGITFVASLALLINRWDTLKSENQLDSLFSREALFLLNNLLFILILVVCLWGVIFPLLSELATGQKVTVGPIFYERATAPLWLGLLLLMGIAPLSVYGSGSWKRLGRDMWKPLVASLIVPAFLGWRGMDNIGALVGYWVAAFTAFVIFYEFWRGAEARHKTRDESLPRALWNLAGRARRRYGGYIIHLGVVLMAFGIIGIELFQSETQATLSEGEQLTFGRYVLTFDKLDQFETPDNRSVDRAIATVYQNGRQVAKVFPRRDFFFESGQSMTIPGIRSTLEDDFYVLLVNWDPGAQKATFKVYHNPLVNFVWLGGLVFIIGTMVAAWPDHQHERVPSRAEKKPSLVRA